MRLSIRYILLVVALLIFDAILLAMLVASSGRLDSERGHYERLNGELVWAYD